MSSQNREPRKVRVPQLDQHTVTWLRKLVDSIRLDPATHSTNDVFFELGRRSLVDRVDAEFRKQNE